MKFLDLLKMANKNKVHNHRVSANSKRGRQLTSAKGSVVVKQDTNEPRDNASSKGTDSTKHI